MVFFERLQTLCDSRGIKATNVMKELGLSTAYPTNWKNGASPSPEHLIAISDYFGVSVDYLLGRTELSQATASDTQHTPAYIRTRKETADMLMYRYQKAIDDASFWLMVELVARLQNNDRLEIFSLVFNVMLEKGYPVAEYWTEAHKYFVRGETLPELWNIGIETTTSAEKQLTIQNIANAVSEIFEKDYAELLCDKSFRQTAKLYKEYPEELRVQILEKMVNWLTEYILKTEALRRKCRMPRDILGWK